jgi:hypothetical protein
MEPLRRAFHAHQRIKATRTPTSTFSHARSVVSTGTSRCAARARAARSPSDSPAMLVRGRRSPAWNASSRSTGMTSICSLGQPRSASSRNGAAAHECARTIGTGLVKQDRQDGGRVLYDFSHQLIPASARLLTRPMRGSPAGAAADVPERGGRSRAAPLTGAERGLLSHSAERLWPCLHCSSNG